MKWITIEDAAEYYKVSPSTIRRRIEDGTLPAKYEKGRWWVLRESHDLNHDLVTFLNRLNPVARPDHQRILVDLVANFAQLKTHHSDVSHLNCKISLILERRPQSFDWDELKRWYWLSQQITDCQEAIGQMKQSGSLNANMIQNIFNNVLSLRDDWKSYHRNIIEKYHRLNPAIDRNPSREGIAVLNRIMAQLEELNKLVYHMSQL